MNTFVEDPYFLIESIQDYQKENNSLNEDIKHLKDRYNEYIDKHLELIRKMDLKDAKIKELEHELKNLRI